MSRSEEFDHGLQSRHTPDDGGLGAAFEQVFGKKLGSFPKQRPLSDEEQRAVDYQEDKAYQRQQERQGY